MCTAVPSTGFVFVFPYCQWRYKFQHLGKDGDDRKQIHLFKFETLEISVFIIVRGFYLISEKWPASFNLLLAISLTSFTDRQGAKTPHDDPSFRPPPPHHHPHPQDDGAGCSKAIDHHHNHHYPFRPPPHPHDDGDGCSKAVQSFKWVWW